MSTRVAALLDPATQTDPWPAAGNPQPNSSDKRLGNGSGGLSGPALLPIGVLATRRVRERVDMPVIGVGGVRNVADAREYLAAGATLVAIGTAALADPRVPVRIARELSPRRG